MDGFENGGMFRSLEEEKLVEAEPQQIARVVIQMLRPERADPKIEQTEMAQDPVK
jgi:hypothetical protein